MAQKVNSAEAEGHGGFSNTVYTRMIPPLERLWTSVTALPKAATTLFPPLPHLSSDWNPDASPHPHPPPVPVLPVVLSIPSV